MKREKRLKCPIWIIFFVEGLLLLGLNAVLFLNLRSGDVAHFPITILQWNALAILGIFIFYTMRMRYDLRQSEDENQLNRMQLEQAKKIIESLYVQRHDFKNQISLIKTWAELGRNQEIIKYLEDENPVITDPDGFDHIHCAVLQALLLMVNTKCRELKIRFSLDSATPLDDFSFPWVKIYHVFSNILTNAIEAVTCGELIENGDAPEIQMVVWDNDEIFHFIVWTPTYLPEGDTKNIFKPGYSTKPSPGHGMGLYIVSRMVRELSGSVWAETSLTSGTEFHVVLPKSHRTVDKDMDSLEKPTLLGWDISKKRIHYH